jgi:hypothetical protein
LDFNRTAHRIHRAGEFDQHPVAGCFDDAAAMRSDGGIDEGFSDRLKPGKRPFLVQTHEPAIASDIRRQHRCQSPLHPLACQKSP